MAEGIIHDTESKMEEFKDQLPADEVKLQPCCLLKTFVLLRRAIGTPPEYTGGYKKPLSFNNEMTK